MFTKWEYVVAITEGEMVTAIDGEEAPFETIAIDSATKRYTVQWLDFLTHMGNAGFELIAFCDGGRTMIFKRPL